MPIKIPDTLPARSILEQEHIFVMTQLRALHQDIRPLRIALVNLMPTKITTETQILRCLANTPLQIEVDLVQMESHTSRNTPEDHLLHFYETFDEIKERVYDGCIITGAPVELMEYEEVDYWPELCRVFEWTKRNVHSTLHICWGAQAGLYYHYGVPKYTLDHKVFGIFPHHALNKKSRLFRGLDDVYWVPHSRNTEVRAADIQRVPQLRLLSVSDEAGVHIVGDQEGRQYFVMGHSEYDTRTLGDEYHRDLEKGLPIAMPRHYYPRNDPARAPVNIWRATAQLLYTNWLNYFVYQTTPFNLKTLDNESLDCAML